MVAMGLLVLCRDVPMGGVAPPPNNVNLQKIWSKGSHAARELTTVFSLTFVFLVTIVVQFVKTPPLQQKVPRHITGPLQEIASEFELPEFSIALEILSVRKLISLSYMMALSVFTPRCIKST